MRNKIIISLAFSAFILTSCGIKGDLDAAPPMWGKAKAEHEKKKEEEKNNQTSEPTNQTQTGN